MDKYNIFLNLYHQSSEFNNISRVKLAYKNKKATLK